MSYRGHVRNGAVVLEGPNDLPEGAEVRVEVINPEVADDPADDPLFRMAELATETGVPDLATNIDHYLYGHPKVVQGE